MEIQGDIVEIQGDIVEIQGDIVEIQGDIVVTMVLSRGLLQATPPSDPGANQN